MTTVTKILKFSPTNRFSLISVTNFHQLIYYIQPKSIQKLQEHNHNHCFISLEVYYKPTTTYTVHNIYSLYTITNPKTKKQKTLDSDLPKYTLSYATPATYNRFDISLLTITHILLSSF